MPVMMLVIVPARREGATCRDALTAEVPWTCWKLRVVNQEYCQGGANNSKSLQKIAIQFHAICEGIGEY
jgi:hypothetical protein